MNCPLVDQSGTSPTRVLVVGGGTMGGGIARVAAHNGCHVSLVDISLDTAQRGVDRIGASLVRAVEKGHVNADTAQRILSRLQPIGSIEGAGDFDVAIEAVREDLEVKRAIFARLEKVAREDALLLSNTSMISITRIAEGTLHPERIAGCHFFNPVPRMELVEVIGGEFTSSDTLQQVTKLMISWGKTPILAPNTSGFLVNRALCIMLNEAVLLVQEGANPMDVDEAMKLGCNHPMGPLELLDLVGIDVALDCIVAMWKGFNCNPKYEPCDLLQRMVQDGKLGRKCGIGFYEYSA